MLRAVAAAGRRNAWNGMLQHVADGSPGGGVRVHQATAGTGPACGSRAGDGTACITHASWACACMGMQTSVHGRPLGVLRLLMVESMHVRAWVCVHTCGGNFNALCALKCIAMHCAYCVHCHALCMRAPPPTTTTPAHIQQLCVLVPTPPALVVHHTSTHPAPLRRLRIEPLGAVCAAPIGGALVQQQRAGGLLGHRHARPAAAGGACGREPRDFARSAAGGAALMLPPPTPPCPSARSGAGR